MRARDFSSLRFPVIPEASILCVGLNLGGDDTWLDTVEPFVTAEERDRARRYARSADAIRHLVGRALVRRVLQAPGLPQTPSTFSLSPWGKPLSPDMEFSISHSGDMVWTAFCRYAAVGIDVEALHPLADLAALTTQLHPDEGIAIRALPPEEQNAAFYRCWTRKEAVLKATGKGLSLPLNSFRVEIGYHDREWIIASPDTTPPACEWTSQDIACGADYHCCVAAQASHLGLAIFVP